MEVTYAVDGRTKTETGLTLAEETGETLFLENEEGAFSTRLENGAIASVSGCRSIGFINFDEGEVADIDEQYLDEPVEHSVHLAPVAMAEQQDSRVYVEMEDGTTFTLQGELDRAYTY